MITINIPDSIEIALQLPEGDKKRALVKYLSIKLYEKGIIGIGKASELCEMNKIDFMKVLNEEEINLNYDDEEYERDLNNLEYFE
jgi:predicted HTH domain antitoxin